MGATRRDFLAVGLAAVGAGSLVDSADGAEGDGIECLDYGRSFICNTSTANAVRFWIESRTILYDDRAGTKAVIYQCGSCKSEHTFAETEKHFPVTANFAWRSSCSAKSLPLQVARPRRSRY